MLCPACGHEFSLEVLLGNKSRTMEADKPDAQNKENDVTEESTEIVLEDDYLIQEDITPDSSTTVFTLTDLTSTTDDIRVYRDGVLLPTTDIAGDIVWSVSGTTLTFTTAPTTGIPYRIKGNAVNKLLLNGIDGSSTHANHNLLTDTVQETTDEFTNNNLFDLFWIISSISFLVFITKSFIFFAYHRIVLDAVEEAVAAKNIKYMRIDGSTSAEKRQANVEAFQANDSIRIAILSIMAAGTGVTLTRVSECVFGELYWVPGVMIQAEDRVHRISQTEKVEIKYLLGTNTLDTYVHPNLCKKLATLDTLVDNRSDRTFEGKTTTMVAAKEESLLSVISKLF
jgi:SNF2 family DNA or RNA helicase